MVTRIVIYHLSGPKRKQVEQFAVDAFAEISIGRDPGSAIQFEGAPGDAVGGKHALIRIAGDPPSFSLSDLGSVNGTWLNGARVLTRTPLVPGDEIELGVGGPKLTFDVQLGTTRRVVLDTDPIAAPEPGALGTARASAGLPMVVARPPARDDDAAAAVAVALHPAADARQPGSPAYALSGLLLLIGLAIAVAGGGMYFATHREAPRRRRLRRDAGRAGGAAGGSGGLAATAPRPSIRPTSGLVEPASDLAGSDTNRLAASPEAPAAPAPNAPKLAALPPPPDAPAASAPAVAAAPVEPAAADAAPEAEPDLTGTVRKIAGASRLMVRNRWIELYGIDDPTTKGQHNHAVYEYLKPYAGAVACYHKGDGRFACFVGGQDLAIIAIHKGFVRLTADAPAKYRALVEQSAATPR